MAQPLRGPPMRPSSILLLTTLAFALALLVSPRAAEVKVPRIGLPRFAHPDSPQTRSAVAAFQATDRLTVSGLFDRATREALKLGVEPSGKTGHCWWLVGTFRCLARWRNMSGQNCWNAPDGGRWGASKPDMGGAVACPSATATWVSSVKGTRRLTPKRLQSCAACFRRASVGCQRASLPRSSPRNASRRHPSDLATVAPVRYSLRASGGSIPSGRYYATQPIRAKPFGGSGRMSRKARLGDGPNMNGSGSPCRRSSTTTRLRLHSRPCTVISV
jgi:hypothetical protein